MSRGLGDVYKRQVINGANIAKITIVVTITRPTTDKGFLLNL